MEPIDDTGTWGGAIGAAAIALHLAVGAILIFVAQRVGRARGGAWRLGIWPPIFAVSLPLCGTLATITWMVSAFGAVANADAASRATMLARGISEAMNLTGLSCVIAWALYVACAVVIAIGHLTRPRAPS